MKTLGNVVLVVLGALLLIGFIIPVGYRVSKINWDWVKDQQEQENVVNTPAVGCPVCPVCEDKTIEVETIKYILPATREQSGTKIEYGTITFDAETRVWVLHNFVVPDVASYSYNYDNGRELGVKNAPFYVGSELNPVNGLPFTICYDTESVGCVPPTEIVFYK